MDEDKQVVKNLERNRKKSATYYEKHKAEVLAKRKQRYESDKERLRAIQREYARKKRAEKKADETKLVEPTSVFDSN